MELLLPALVLLFPLGWLLLLYLEKWQTEAAEREKLVNLLRQPRAKWTTKAAETAKLLKRLSKARAELHSAQLKRQLRENPTKA
jgi:hypothetical protein